jgi:hypothetical protein
MQILAPELELARSSCMRARSRHRREEREQFNRFLFKKKWLDIFTQLPNPYLNKSA